MSSKVKAVAGNHELTNGIFGDVKKSSSHRYLNREYSWLAFNHRVLQEAIREDNPLIERIRFLGIFSNNLDEFFRVRVANLQRAFAVDQNSKTTLGFDVEETLKGVQDRVLQLQEDYNKAFEQMELDLRKSKIRILNEREYSPEQAEFVSTYFKNQIRTHLVPIMIDGARPFPDLQDGVIYFVVGMEVERSSGWVIEYALIKIPPHLPRFVILPSENEGRNVSFIDDIIRNDLHRIFRLFQPKRVFAHAIKVTRDAEIDMDDDLSRSLMEKISDGLVQRKKGDFVRLIYDREMPEDMLRLVKSKLDLTDSKNVISGSRYHNRKDLMKFPSFGREELTFRHQPPLQHPRLKDKSSLIQQVLKHELLLHFPYHTFGHIVDILREAAIDPHVTQIQINLYRVAQHSKIINALINAAHNGKRVDVIIELAARFDERQNINVSNLLQEAGITVGFGVTGLKVHSKLFLITRKQGSKRQRIAYIGTGNFHEKSAEVFSDFGLLTAEPAIAHEVDEVFSFFNNNYKRLHLKHLIVSPYDSRKRFNQMVRQEMRHAESGVGGRIILKLNNLVDAAMIEVLYAASQSGVKVDLIVRGICSLIPGIPGMSENIRVRSIVGRYLEHGRVLYFANAGNPKFFISSADWMTRNLDRRVEVSVPITDPVLQSQIVQFLEDQMKDNLHARLLDASMSNKMIKGRSSRTATSSQETTYQRYKNELNLT
ncbi:MAG: polyphosphate kinase 1 [Bacteroidetes bacterium]|nr:polyphosphate kinase 1 [Bacteroidota bacterium]MDA1335768.1 polyphosphate kinase 1 [Bacteroidota bacterium]